MNAAFLFQDTNTVLWYGGRESSSTLIAQVIAQIDFAFAEIINTGFARQNVIGDHGSAHAFTQFDLGFVFLEFTTADQNGAARGLDRMATFLFLVPLHEGAVAEADGPFTRHFGNLIARTPEGAIHETDRSGVGFADADHGRIWSMERNEFAVGNQQAKTGGIVNHHRGETIVRANPKEISVTYACPGLDELVTNAVPEAKRVIDILPIAASEDEGLAVLLLPLQQFRLVAPPGVEVDILDPANVVDIIDVNPPAQRLSLNVPDEVALVMRGINSVIRIEQLDPEHRWILPAQRNTPGIGFGLIGRILFWIIQYDTLQRAVVVERDKCGAFLFIAIFRNQKRRPFIGRFWKTSGTEANM